MKKILILALTVLTVGIAAQKVSAQKVQIGARVGISSDDTGMKFYSYPDAKEKLGWHLAAVSRFRLVGFGRGMLGAGLYLQPEIVYTQHNIKSGHQVVPTDDHTRALFGGGDNGKTSMSTVDIPVLLSAKVSILRVNAGPVFNVMTKFSEDTPVSRPAVGYAVGASVDLGLLTIDGRYHGDFNKMNFKGDLDDLKGRFSSWSLGVGVMF